MVRVRLAFTCGRCRKAFTFAEAVEVKESWEETADHTIRNLYHREPEPGEIEDWVGFMQLLLLEASDRAISTSTSTDGYSRHRPKAYGLTDGIHVITWASSRRWLLSTTLLSTTQCCRPKCTGTADSDRARCLTSSSAAVVFWTVPEPRPGRAEIDPCKSAKRDQIHEAKLLQMMKAVVGFALATAYVLPLVRLAEAGIATWTAMLVVGAIGVPLVFALVTTVLGRKGPFKDWLIRVLCTISLGVALGVVVSSFATQRLPGFDAVHLRISALWRQWQCLDSLSSCLA